MSDTFITFVGFFIVFIATVLGSALVFFLKRDISDRQNALLTGIASGVMVAASVFSLLIPSIESFSSLKSLKFLPTACAFIVGGIFFSLTEIFIKKIIPRSSLEGDGGARCEKPLRTFIAMTVHNLPEGLAVGFSFGSASFGGRQELLSALMLSIGIAIQNFPEGAAVSLPMRDKLSSPFKAFLIGALSGVIEPIAALLGFYFSTSIGVALPYIMAFAAGTMIFVVIEDIMPEAHGSKLSSWGFMAGFALMMALDVAL